MLGGVFIREIVKKNPGYDKTFFYHRLMDSVRTPKGPRQRIILNLGHLDLPRQDWKTLANRIEEILSSVRLFSPPPPHIESLAQYYAQQLNRKEMSNVSIVPQKEFEWETVDLNSVALNECHTIGGETIAYHFFNKLGFPQIFADIGFSQDQIDKATLLIIGRLLHPASEVEILLWGKRVSALEELLNTSFQHWQVKSLERMSDQLLEHRQDIERRLFERECEIWDLGGKISLLDITHTCNSFTMALLLNEDGFLKGSIVVSGNVHDSKVMGRFLEVIKDGFCGDHVSVPTVVVKDGSATEDGLQLLRQEGFRYISVRRCVDDRREDSDRVAKRLDCDGEAFLYHENHSKVEKDEARRSILQGQFEQGLQSLAASLVKKQGIKRYDKVMERLERLRAKYPSVSQFYLVAIQQESGVAKRICWEIDENAKLRAKLSASYCLRTDLTDLSDEYLWSLYAMLMQVEASMNEELGLGMTCHGSSICEEGHLFVAVLAYHLLAGVRKELRGKGINYPWREIRTQLSTQVRATYSLTNDKNERLHFKQTASPDSFYSVICEALGITSDPLGTKLLRR